MVSVKMFNIGQTAFLVPRRGRRLSLDLNLRPKEGGREKVGPALQLTSQSRLALASMRNNVRNHVKKAAPEWEAGSNPALRTPVRTLHPYTQFPSYLGKVGVTNGLCEHSRALRFFSEHEQK